MKKTVTMLLAGTMLCLLCSGSVQASEPQGNLPVYNPGDTIRIGVPIYDATDATLLSVKEYFSYLEENMNIEFVYSEALGAPADEINFVENCAIGGCQGILGFYNVMGSTIIDICEKNGLYYIGTPSNIDRQYDKYKTYPNWLGGITTNEKNYLGAYATAAYMESAGCEKVIFASGGADFGVQLFVDLRQGFYDGLEALGSDMEVVELSGFPGDDWFTRQSSLLADPDIDGVCGFGGIDMWAQPIFVAGRSNDITLAVSGAMLTDTYLEAMQDGLFGYCDIDNYYGIYALDIAFLINALNGDTDLIKPNGEAQLVEATFWKINSVEQFEELYNEVSDGNVLVTVDDLNSMIKASNPDVTLDDIIAIGTETDLDVIHARHGE